MHESKAGAEPEDYGNSGGRRPMPFREHHRQQNPEQRKDGPHRKIDASSDDHNADTDAENPKGTDQPRHILNVGGAEKLWIFQSHDDAESNEKREDSEFFSRHATAN